MTSQASGMWPKFFGEWHWPADRLAWIALGLATLAMLGVPLLRLRAAALRHITSCHPIILRCALLAIAGTAFALSHQYVATYLHGQPRIIDATMYYLQASLLSRGQLAFETDLPLELFSGRFLQATDSTHLAGIFPLGYPLVLAIGFKLGQPMLVGPALAFFLTLATYGLARECEPRGVRSAMPLIAAALSAVCFCLRYHTADTMSHGATALWFTLAMICLLRASQNDEAATATDRLVKAKFWLALAGTLTGFAVLTRIASSSLRWGLLFACSLTKTGYRPARSFKTYKACITHAATFRAIVFATGLARALAASSNTLTTFVTRYLQATTFSALCGRSADGFGCTLGTLPMARRS
jgi:hypothetical protein